MEAWWAAHARSHDRAAFDRDVAAHQTEIRTGKFGDSNGLSYMMPQKQKSAVQQYKIDTAKKDAAERAKGYR